MRHGVRLCFDVGAVRIGVAKSDQLGMLAVPVETMSYASNGAHLARAVDLVTELEVFEVIVGLPLNLQGAHTKSTTAAISFATALAAALARHTSNRSVDVRLVDERLSTTTAQGHMRQAGRSTRKSRDIIDQQAAVIILEHALDLERSLGSPPGSLVDTSADREEQTQ